MAPPLAPEELDRNLKAKEALCREAERLKESTLWRETADRLKEMQQEWKTIGPVPAEFSESIYQKFRTACDAFFENRTRSFQNQELERIDNLYRKLEICDKAEALKNHGNLEEAAAEMHQLFVLWKEIGPVPREKTDALWDRFRTAQDVIFQKRKVVFEEKDREREENLKAKTALCIEAETLAGSDDFHDTAARIIALQEQWKATGPVPKEQADAIWDRFKSSCDHFFQRRNAHLNMLDEQRLANLITRQRISQEAIQLRESLEWNETSDKIRQLQLEWKQAWPVPKDEGDMLWDTFRGACDHFFERKRIFFEEKRKSWQKNQSVWRMNMEKVIARKEEEIVRLEAALEFERNHITEWQLRLEKLPGELRSIDMKMDIEEKIARSHAELERKQSLIAQLITDIADIRIKLEKE